MLRSQLTDWAHLPPPPVDPPQSDLMKSHLKLGDDKKIEVALRLLDLHKSHSITWHQQAYIAAAASIGVTAYIFNNYASQSSHSWDRTRWIYVIGIAIFAVLSQWYLEVAACNYWGNQTYIIKSEYALKLKDEEEYFTAASPQDVEKTRFYPRPAKDVGMPPEDIILLAWSHLLLSAMLWLALIFLR
jgi:hypothetical protein